MSMGCFSLGVPTARTDTRERSRTWASGATVAGRVEPPQNDRQARALERLAINAIARRSPRCGKGDETLASFFLEPWSENGKSGRGRWTRDFPNGRGESTLVHNTQRVRPFAERYRDRTLRSITRAEARRQANDHAATVAALRAAWNDAARDGLIDENVFSSLGLERRKGRADIVPLTLEEVHRLAEIAIEFYGTDAFGHEVSASIIWAAYTMGRPGEAFAARRSLLHGDAYHLQSQMNSLLARRRRRSTAASASSTSPSGPSKPSNDSRAASTTTSSSTPSAADSSVASRGGAPGIRSARSSRASSPAATTSASGSP